MDSRKILLKFYWIAKRFLVPTLKYSQYLYEDVLNSYVSHDKTWLDLGCGHEILPEWRSEEEKQIVNRCKMVVGIDFDLYSLKKNKNIVNKLRGDISNLPFKNEAFDLLTANMVVEHLEDPIIQFKEMNRVLKLNGIFIFHTPNILGYIAILGRLIPRVLKNKILFIFQGRKQEDIYEAYYKANSSKSVVRLAKKTGFKILKIKMLVSSAQFIIIPPLMLVELIWIRILMTSVFKPLRTNIIAILEKQRD